MLLCARARPSLPQSNFCNPYPPSTPHHPHEIVFPAPPTSTSAPLSTPDHYATLALAPPSSLTAPAFSATLTVSPSTAGTAVPAAACTAVPAAACTAAPAAACTAAPTAACTAAPAASPHAVTCLTTTPATWARASAVPSGRKDATICTEDLQTLRHMTNQIATLTEPAGK
ncbi:hypothetical protein BC938DRAFT_471245 [Jimgerdemannia flammicorona]|uniref:Uncharacterized protein n=1 Tax=Jimgerdemannia flammicorona TaxID=994334 RepID=A0A433Q8L2_9FUNG|nr:hypothetical protein BC938DRAFT_471245 [Jimgerdemannia flammicorona]